MHINRSIINKIVIAIYFISIFTFAIYSYIKPYYSYDLIPYTASTISLEQDNAEKIQSETYRIIKDSVPNEIFKAWTSGEFGRRMYKDFQSFNQTLNFYKVKPLYLYFIYFLHKCGIGIVNAIYLISACSYIGISVLLFLSIRGLRAGLTGTIILTLLLVCRPLMIAGGNTPDALSAFIITLSLFVLLNKRMKILSGILLFFSILIRPDNIIFSSILFLYLGIVSPKQYRLKLYQTTSFLLILVIGHFSINYFEHAYGWKTLFVAAFSTDFNTSFGIKDYLHVLLYNGIYLLNTHAIYFIVIGLFSLIISKVTSSDPVHNHLIVISTFVMIVYFLLFPSKEVDRYFITEYVVILMSTLRNICSIQVSDGIEETIKIDPQKYFGH
ncbi:hypothetical protein RCG23_21230 [Neobacillus sp. PS3-34]|uniref:hypothetical protein n=1 Tax=Neobacillus sp. PS3-34 TaxID=3070678 RepID=UPI0027E02FE2|nr:hypothetical protein [Neobacillus sp. PS3-34]WML47824.1 hypothetical protein RCG23_21230 [Neobacillus sp. PS3-34]